MSRSKLWMSLATIVSAVLAWLAAPQICFAQTASQWIPLTAEMMVVDQSPDGSTFKARKIVLGIRPDGSRAELFLETNQQQDRKKKVTLLNEKRQVMIDPATESNTTYVLNADSLRKQSQRPACQPPENSETEMILGYRVFRFAHEDDYKQSRVKWEEWLAPELNCMALRSVSEGIVSATGERIGRQTLEVTRVVLGSPEDGLFAIPSDYVERAPSDVFRELDRRRSPVAGPKACASCDPLTNQRLDRVYYAARVK